MHLGVIVAFAFTALVSCEDRRDSAAVADSSNRTVRSASPPGSQTSSAFAWQDSTCAVDRSPAHPEPAALVREYATRNDSLGFFVGDNKPNDDWLLRAAECPGHLGGADGVGIVAQYRIDSLRVLGDSGWFVVVYKGVGAFDANDGLRGQTFTRVDTQVVVRTPFGWRLSGQVGDPMISIRAASRVLTLRAVDRARLDSLAQSNPRSRPGA
jgi:hypothetical protein